ncbi:SCO family protein [Hymenobacter elongatus]|uniref:SCO family protein n=1 Tax=Hymenobacter elongatus TaxID=877208 RepID=A0A4Z0PK93_9BACT|nr:SCO family protein [Hymenobacter elongatus]TGE16257.1 SCO family protein [Hymenobacter elongatus]
MRPKQTLFLGLILLLPVLAFLFLKTFGTNRFALPTYLPERVDSTQIGGEWQRDTVFHTLADFRLPSQLGRVVSQQDLNGGLYVTSFLSTPCSGACQTLNSQLMRVQEKFRRESRVRLVSYTTDSVAVLARYAEQYGAIAGKWFFLTGDKTALYRLATQEYRLPTPAGATPGLVQSQNLFLVDREKRVRGIYDGTKVREVNRLITEISVLLYNYDHDKPSR